MINNLQTSTADLLIWIGPMGNTLWKITSLLCIGTLMLMALANYFVQTNNDRAYSKNNYISHSYEIFFYLLLAFTILLLRLPGISRLETNPDAGGLVAGAHTLLVDPRFWISVENTTLGPLSTFSLTLIPLFGGGINYGTIKLLAIIICILSVLLLYKAFVNIYGAKIAKVIILPFAATIATFTFWDFISFNGEHIPLLLLSLGVYFLSRVLTNRDQYISAFMLGLTLGMVPFGKVQAAPIAFIFGSVIFIFLLIEKDKRYLVLLIGSLIPASLILIYLFSSGAFPDFWQSYILNNLKYASEGFFSQNKNVTFLQKAASLPGFLSTAPDTRLFFISHFTIGMIGLVIILSRWGAVSKLDKKLSIITVSVLLITLYCILTPGNNWTHYLILLFVPVVLLFGTAIGVTNKIFGITTSNSRIRNVIIIGFFVVATTIIPTIYVLKQHNVAFLEAKLNSENGKNITDASRKILEYAKPGDRMAVWGFFLNNYVETGLIQGTREAHTERQLDKSPQQKYYINRWLSDLKINKPPVFVQSLYSQWTQYTIDNYPAIKEYIDNNYQLVSTSDVIYNYHSWTQDIYISNDRLAHLRGYDSN